MKLLAAFSLFDNVDINGNNLGGFTQLLFNAIRLLLYVAGLLAVIFVIIGALQYITSAGNPQATAKAKSTLVYAIGGLILSILAVSIVDFIINTFVK